MASLIELDHLRYWYPLAETPALHIHSLRLDAGMSLVAGASGGGKSTLLRLMNGLIPHFHGGRIGGSARVAGHEVLATPTRRLARDIGFVFQDPERQAVRARVDADVAFALENTAVPRSAMVERVEAALSAVGAGHLAGRRISELSGGERQRVAIAGALALRPRLLVLDEPLAQLDPSGAAEVVAACMDLRQAGVALLVSEHRLDRLLPVADRLLLVEAGRARGPGPCRELAAALASPPQVVELGRRLGWQPLPLGPEEVDGRLGTPGVATAATSAGGDIVWEIHDAELGIAGESVLEGVTLAGRRGEVLALMGDNGSGKTTLLRALAGLLMPRRGRVQRAPGRAAYLPQDPAALLHRPSVGAEVDWTIRRARSREPAGRLLGALGLEALVDRDPRDLSSGQRQRAAVAAVLAGTPSLALLDEPTRGMDGHARAGMVRVIRELASAGCAVVLATHDSDLAAEVADRVVRLEAGRAVEAGPPRQALSGDRPLATQIGRLLPGLATTVDEVAPA